MTIIIKEIIIDQFIDLEEADVNIEMAILILKRKLHREIWRSQFIEHIILNVQGYN